MSHSIDIEDHYGISIAFVIHSVDHSLFTRLILQKTQFLTVRSIVPIEIPPSPENSYTLWCKTINHNQPTDINVNRL